MSADDKAFIDRARASLDQRLEQTPAHIRSQLTAARHRALDSRRCGARLQWLPAMATAALVAVVVSGVWFNQAPTTTAPVVAGLTQQAGDFEMLMRGDDLALYEDMDFYLWLDNQGTNAG